MKEKIFITGGGGMLASQIENFYNLKGKNVSAPTHAQLDVLNSAAVREAVISFKPDYVFHTAALHVDASEENPQLAFELNVKASESLAKVCSKVGSVLIYISSCGYFGDEIRYYVESDPVVLKTVYARTKHEGEQLSLKFNKKTFAIRPGWLFGGKITHKKNFVYQRYLEAKKSKIVKSASDKYGCPTYVEELVEKMDEIIRSSQFGLYHLTNSWGCTRAEYIKKIIKSCKLKTEVEPVDSSHFARKANVPNCELLNNYNMRNLGLSPMSPWEEAVERYIKIMLKEIN
ncbi:MAG: NAD(P)-dependent oxidoreductase [Candidatus Omnitrophica bacterium]|jgi:dTDP-4-dehydrorhamnose reductase|nr:NAD(P)-dependent oxidoreductase [Candidatus Omnitrophota bacterium]